MTGAFGGKLSTRPSIGPARWRVGGRCEDKNRTRDRCGGCDRVRGVQATGTAGGFTLAGTAATTTFAVSGLAPATTYRFRVRDRDAVPNFSPDSPTVTVTTLSEGGGARGCRVSYAPSNWGGSTGFTANLTITNTGAATINSLIRLRLSQTSSPRRETHAT